MTDAMVRGRSVWPPLPPVEYRAPVFVLMRAPVQSREEGGKIHQHVPRVPSPDSGAGFNNAQTPFTRVDSAQPVADQ